MAGEMVMRSVLNAATNLTDEEEKQAIAADKQYKDMNFSSHEESCRADASILEEKDWPKFFDSWLNSLNLTEQQKAPFQVWKYCTGSSSNVEEFLFQEKEGGKVVYGQVGFMKHDRKGVIRQTRYHY